MRLICVPSYVITRTGHLSGSMSSLLRLHFIETCRISPFISATSSVSVFDTISTSISIAISISQRKEQAPLKIQKPFYIYFRLDKRESFVLPINGIIIYVEASTLILDKWIWKWKKWGSKQQRILLCFWCVNNEKIILNHKTVYDISYKCLLNY